MFDLFCSEAQFFIFNYDKSKVKIFKSLYSSVFIFNCFKAFKNEKNFFTGFKPKIIIFIFIIFLRQIKFSWIVSFR